VHFDPSLHFTKHKASMLDRVSQFALIAAQQAVKNSGFDMESADKSRIGVSLGTGMAGSGSVEEGYVRLYKEGASRLKPFTVLMAMNNAAASHIAMEFALTGPNFTYSTACSSSAIAIGEAAQKIRYGMADMMLAGGAEALLTIGTLKAWEALRTLAKEDAEDASTSSKPFSADRSGLVLGEGAGVVVLEDYDKAVARGATIYAEITGYGCTNDPGHITQPSPDRQAAAMQAALNSAKLSIDDIDYINAHGTATMLNDAAETAAIKLVFGEKAKQVPVSSTKSMHGHLMGAAAAVEFIACVMALNHSAIPPTMNLKNPDPDCDLDYVPNAARRNVPLKHVMSNSFAFGGTSGVLIASRVDA
jgi:3-oxoacyl-[acyl-carrier-protein] synthase II